MTAFDFDLAATRGALTCDRPGCACHRRTGNVHCPAHHDPGPSLSVTERNGRPLVRCHAGCAQDAVIEALRARNLWPPEAATIAQNGHSRRVSVTYDYTDESGTLLYQAVRYDPKGFSQRRPDGHGGWAWTLNGTRRVLYRLPDLLAADSERAVFVCEGEKDADRLWSLGLIATTCAQGAGKWRDEYRAALTDRHVAILPDNDPAGRAHAEQVAASGAPVARSVRIVTLPGLPAKGDVSDWLDAGGTVDQLRELWKQTEEWQPPDDPLVEPEVPDGPRLVVTSLADVEARPVDWLWHRWLARGKFHILAGIMGEGKGTLTAAITAAFSTGGTLPDATPAPSARVLFVLSEDALDDTLKPRLDVHGADATKVMAIEAVHEADGSPRMVNLSRHLSLIEAAIKDHEIDVVVVDAISDFMSGTDRNAEGDVRDVLTPLAQMADRTKVAVIGVMHLGKPSGTNRRLVQMLLGSSAFGAVARVVWATAEIPDSGGHRVLEVIKSNLAIKPPAVEWSRAEDAAIVWHGESERRVEDIIGASLAKPRDNAEGFLNELLKGGMRPASEVMALAKAAGYSVSTVRRAREDMGIELRRVGFGPGGRVHWKLPTGGDDNPDDEPPPTGKPHVAHNSGDNDWYTPPEYIEAARAVLGTIDLDPASSAAANEVVRATRFYTVEDDGLKQPWSGRVWMNPPYKQPAIAQFCTRLAREYTTGAVTEAVALVNNATETTWFRELTAHCAAICFPRGRVRYWHPHRDSLTPLQGQAVLYLGRHPERFRAAFARLGLVTVPTEADTPPLMSTPIDTVDIYGESNAAADSPPTIDVHESNGGHLCENPHQLPKMSTVQGRGHLCEADDDDGTSGDGASSIDVHPIYRGGHLCDDDTIPPTGSGVYVCAGCNLPRSRDEAPCPHCGETEGVDV